MPNTTPKKRRLLVYCDERAIYPNFNIGTNTARVCPEDVWKHPYRHWNFKPAQVTSQAR
jgi:hypothetical protein